VGALALGQRAPAEAQVAQAGDLVRQRDVDDRGPGTDDLRAQGLLALGVVVDAAVFGERVDHRRDRLAEAVADVLEAARRVLDDVVQEPDDLHVLVVSGVAQDVGHRLRVGKPLARSGPDAVIGVDQKGDRLRRALRWLRERRGHGIMLVRRASAGPRRRGSGSGAPLRLGCAGCARHGLEEKCPCDRAQRPRGGSGPA
jgi:hypothetical protein